MAWGQPSSTFTCGTPQQGRLIFSVSRCVTRLVTNPLQQYLIALGEDRLQVAPFAYDTRPETAGGQRWIHLESFAGPDRMARFDWRQPLQNWNGMCADCHSRGFRRGYDPATQLFNSSFDAINVDCLACHNQGARHIMVRERVQLGRKRGSGFVHPRRALRTGRAPRAILQRWTPVLRATVCARR